MGKQEKKRYRNDGSAHSATMAGLWKLNTYKIVIKIRLVKEIYRKLFKCEKDDFKQGTAWKAPVRWWKYTAVKNDDNGNQQLSSLNCPIIY